jgi:hypothetical protein
MAITRLYAVTMQDKSEMFIESTSQAAAMNYAAKQTMKIRIPTTLETAKFVGAGGKVQLAVPVQADIQDEVGVGL